MSWINQSKSSTPATNQSKSSSTPTNYLRHGKEPTMAELENYKFTSVVFEDGTQLGAVTFDELTDASWTNQSKS